MREASAEAHSITERIEPSEIDDRRTAFERRIGATERRSSPRKKILKNGRTYWPNGDSIDCGIRNISETGVQLEIRGPIPSTFELVIDRDQFRRTCFVVWRNASRVGVRFGEASGPIRAPERPVAGITEFRQYAEACRALAQGSYILSREMLLKMAEAWEAQARRPRKRADSW